MAIQVTLGERYPKSGDFDVLRDDGHILAMVTKGPRTGKTWVSCNGRCIALLSRRKALEWLSDTIRLPAIEPHSRTGC